jgi:spermidine synthase
LQIKPNNRLVTLLGFAFFLSGFSALLYQVVWQRMLGLFSGSDSRSVTIITAAYLGGLGVGSLLGSVYADRLSSRRAVRAYALCNLGIAVFAVASRFLYYDLLFKRFTWLAESPLVLLVTVFASLLWPTTLMGLSLPLLSKALVRTISGAAGIISRLYGINTLGAGIGALVSGWFLIGLLGYDRSLFVGAFISAIVGGVAWLVSGRLDTGDQEKVSEQKLRNTNLDLRNVPRSVWTWCFFVFISGFLIISLELIWFRVLDFLLKSNAYTFGHLLAIYLIGDGLGSLVGSRYVRRIANPRAAFMWLQGLISLIALGTIWLVSNAANQPGGLLSQYILSADGRSLLVNLQQQGGASAGIVYALVILYLILPLIILLAPSFLVGFYYPIVQKAIQTDSDVVGQRVGLVEVSNIMGNTMGSILTGAILFAVLGTANSLRLIGIIGLVFVAALLYENFGKFRTTYRVVGTVLSGALLLVVVAFPPTNQFWANMHVTEPGQYFVVAEDASGVAALRGSTENGKTSISIWANGRDQGNVAPFDTFHSFLGVLPALIHPAPRRVMVVGVGSGNTPYAVGINPDIQAIDAVEIIGPELEVLADFQRDMTDSTRQTIRQLYQDHRYRLIVSDGRREIDLAKAPYDIIVVDAVLPWTSHAGLLFSIEFYEAAYNRLAPGGLVVEWSPTHRSEASFVSVFPYVVKIADIVLVGSNQPIPYQPAVLIQRLQEPRTVDYLATGGVDPRLMYYWIQSEPIASWLPDTPRLDSDINTDLFPKDEEYLNNEVGPIHYPAAGKHWFTFP